MPPEFMKAVVTTGDGGLDLMDVAVPQIQPDEILVQVLAAAQNPTDWKTIMLHKVPGNVLGCDFAGVVVQIGHVVPSGLRFIGERVAGSVHGGIGPNGAYAEYVAMQWDLAISLPETMTFEDAAQLGTACYTTCQALYQYLDLPTPFDPPASGKTLLVWSGTSSTGQYAIQFAKLAGLRVISTSSPQHFDFVRSLGADEVYDYADSWTSKKIFASTEGKLTCAIDCISTGMTPNQVSVSLSSEGGTIATLLPYESKKRGVKTVFTLAYSIFGKDIEFPFSYPANIQHRENGATYARLIAQLISQQMLRPIPIKLYSDGLASVKDGLEYMRSGKVRAEKITYRILDTPGL